MRKNQLHIIRESIKAALIYERNTGELRAFLDALAPKLHKTISLPQDMPGGTLWGFIVHYIKTVPEYLEVLTKLLQEAGTLGEAQVFINIAEEFFIDPPETVQQQAGLKALIDEAYLAHRLIEEINDRLLMLCGAPLTPMDMTLSNIIVHDLLGEEFANQLDLAVHFAIESLFNPEEINEHSAVNAFLSRHNAAAWGEALENWPCMARDLAISLELSSSQQAGPLH